MYTRAEILIEFPKYIFMLEDARQRDDDVRRNMFGQLDGETDKLKVYHVGFIEELEAEGNPNVDLIADMKRWRDMFSDWLRYGSNSLRKIIANEMAGWLSGEGETAARDLAKAEEEEAKLADGPVTPSAAPASSSAPAVPQLVEPKADVKTPPTAPASRQHPLPPVASGQRRDDRRDDRRDQPRA